MVATTITFNKPGVQAPVYVAGNFTNWTPIEMKHEPVEKDGVVENHFSYTVDLEPGEFQYKFRLGPGDWWVLDESTPTANDGAGNINNVLAVKPEETIVSAAEVSAGREPEQTHLVSGAEDTQKSIPAEEANDAAPVVETEPEDTPVQAQARTQTQEVGREPEPESESPAEPAPTPATAPAAAAAPVPEVEHDSESDQDEHEHEPQPQPTSAVSQPIAEHEHEHFDATKEGSIPDVAPPPYEEHHAIPVSSSPQTDSPSPVVIVPNEKKPPKEVVNNAAQKVQAELKQAGQSWFAQNPVLVAAMVVVPVVVSLIWYR
ncbi:hypothetical protein HRR83_009453 [Exophiala dermatitidis]|uniref:AMP-activated protein kinase glycogen-binding domain-containing protein n=3 Tax=Exophiala dermatitidis TaxID=5970 RepID=H6C2P6_EXODN|nr:uncharacterized protein HMPREF1120_05984 [Exophiala dermatitidis NIH/UT8656]KAJ4501968.1 hypothetical protein HRR75_008741 [Exophiala dermatitidis]EHY57964.1 hypothetical protein HMPREF1120_05984 [Exophiala dermatitidis NIH/UT8656]KAJ4502290.1 hypothetical protein HRR73_009500 [Exophiala dermatitidis]KAJ4502743.1 hypothetical protein HRR74_009500 [Exophiala dermatitidis]KAJ4531449.1 hypothetical protein HRR77_009484 [Exophiala dermatitidis]